MRAQLFGASAIQVRTDAMLFKGARLVGSTRNVDLTSARLEAIGDAWMAQYAVGFARPVLRSFLPFHSNWFMRGRTQYLESGN